MKILDKNHPYQVEDATGNKCFKHVWNQIEHQVYIIIWEQILEKIGRKSMWQIHDELRRRFNEYN